MQEGASSRESEIYLYYTMQPGQSDILEAEVGLTFKRYGALLAEIEARPNLYRRTHVWASACDTWVGGTLLLLLSHEVLDPLSKAGKFVWGISDGLQRIAPSVVGKAPWRDLMPLVRSLEGGMPEFISGFDDVD